MTNLGCLQGAYSNCGEFLDEAVIRLREAYQELEVGNMGIRDLPTYERIRDIKIRHAELECYARQFWGSEFAESGDKKSAQCWNCEGLGKIQVDTSEMACPVCDGSGTLAYRGVKSCQ